MTDTLHEHADPTLHKGEALVEMIDVGGPSMLRAAAKNFGPARISPQQ